MKYLLLMIYMTLDEAPIFIRSAEYLSVRSTKQIKSRPANFHIVAGFIDRHNVIVCGPGTLSAYVISFLGDAKQVAFL